MHELTGIDTEDLGELEDVVKGGFHCPRST
jgi:hypothetical protein